MMEENLNIQLILNLGNNKYKWALQKVIRRIMCPPGKVGLRPTMIQKMLEIQ